MSEQINYVQVVGDVKTPQPKTEIFVTNVADAVTQSVDAFLADLKRQRGEALARLSFSEYNNLTEADQILADSYRPWEEWDIFRGFRQVQFADQQRVAYHAIIDEMFTGVTKATEIEEEEHSSYFRSKDDEVLKDYQCRSVSRIQKADGEYELIVQLQKVK